MNFNLLSDMERNSVVGFRFHPTDHELVYKYLREKLNGLIIHCDDIPEINIYNYEPSDLPDFSRRRSEDDALYFFCARNYKSSKSQRSKRTTHAGYWKPTGKPRVVKHKITKKKIGTKRTLVFHFGRPKGIRTEWVMHEYEYTDNRSKDGTIVKSNQGEFVLCKIKSKSDSMCDRNESSFIAPTFTMDETELNHLVVLSDKSKSSYNTNNSSDFLNGNENQILANASVDGCKGSYIVASADQVEPSSVQPYGMAEESDSSLNKIISSIFPSEETVLAMHRNEDSYPMLFDSQNHIPDSNPVVSYDSTYRYILDIEDQLARISQELCSKENHSPNLERRDYYELFNFEDEVFLMCPQ